MKITKQQISDTKVKLSIELDASELKSATQVALTKIARTLKVPGFRKGKVPVAVAAKHVNPSLLAEETVDNALSKAVAEAFLKEDLRALERPSVEITKFVPEKQLEFTAEAEVLPEIKLGNHKKLKPLKQEVAKADKVEVDEILDRIRTQMAEKKEVKRAAKLEDEVVIDFVGKRDGEPFDGGSGNDYPLTLGSNSFIPGFEEAIVNHEVGETFDIDIKFPKDYGAKDLAGKPAVFTVTIKSIFELVKPELTDELAAKVGPYTSVDDLKKDIEGEIIARKNHENIEKQQDHLIGQLVDASKVPVPEVLKKSHLESIERDMTQNLLYQGLSIDEYLRTMGHADKDAWLKDEATPLAEKRVKASLVLSELAKKENITASEDELKAKLAELKRDYSKQPGMAKRFDEPEVIQSVANQILTEKTVNLLMRENVK